MKVKDIVEGENITQKRMFEKQNERIAQLVAEAKEKESKSTKPMEGKANGKSSKRNSK